MERESRARTERARCTVGELTAIGLAAIGLTVVERDSSTGFESIGGLRENSFGGLPEEAD